MTCMDCIHYDVCEKRKNSISLDPVKCGYRCPDFKNKADYQNEKQKAQIEGLQNELSVLQFKNSDLLRDHKELNIQLESMRSAANSYKMHYEEAQAEIERLQAMHKEMCIGMKVLKRNAIKEFWDKLKEKRYGGIYPYVLITEGDNLVKEMEGETK